MKICSILLASLTIATMTASPVCSGEPCSKENVVKAVNYAADLLQKKGTSAIPELEKFRFCGEEGYVWISDMDGLFLMHPISKKLVGVNQVTLQDPKGKYIIAEMIAKVKKDGHGWVGYSWVNPVTNKIAQKCSYAMGTTMDGKKVWVAAGVYSEVPCK